MLHFESKVRKWGRSLGIVVPKEGIEKEGIKANDAIDLFIVRKSNALKETFGTMRFTKPIRKIMEEIDREAWPE
ncbi:AbrB/MazE/SpoVT family DNA-binding domain-containing protein [Candidatus Woesearchaeota archaeon]|nr:AbrB/MazE/SpoVT family DNA-binding domain-containing protein [Candidatus Woesearchaeota archaeon]